MARLIRWFAVHPDAAPHVRALERGTGLRPRSLQNEIARLVALGILVREADGRRVRYRLDETNSAWTHLRELVRHLSHPADVLPFAVGDVTGIEAAFVFGSHAKGEARPDSDVDLFVLGDDIDEAKLLKGTLETGVLLGREVNVVSATRAELAERASTAFYRDMLAGPKQWVRGSAVALDEVSVPA